MAPQEKETPARATGAAAANTDAADRAVNAMLGGRAPAASDGDAREMIALWDEMEGLRASPAYADLLGAPTLRERLVGQLRRAAASTRRYALPAASTLALAGAATAFLLYPRGVHYDAKGAALQLTLPDRTTLLLAPHSKLDFREQDGKRLATLSGEAQFSIAHDTAHPFLIQAGEAQVRVVGTRFTLAYRAPCTQLSVLQGTVAMHSSSMPARLLRAGEATVNIDAGHVYQACLSAPSKQDSARLSYVDVPLSTVIADAGRFYPKKIVIGSARLAKEHVTMTFRVDEIDEMIKLIPAVVNAKVDQKSPALVVIEDR